MGVCKVNGENYTKTKKRVGYIHRNKAKTVTYSKLGFRCGLEIHQQLKTEKKLFCRCPAGFYQDRTDFDAEIVRHMRPTLSELGEYDGTALMEFKTRKNIFYWIKNSTACTYEIDDTPPFKLNREALETALEVALILKTSIVGELHITRKQYLDGSIPTGFQRTAIVGIDGSIPLRGKNIKIIQLSIEEDSCREVSDIGHKRIYTTDRLGIPLIETVTEPVLLTPDEAVEAGQYLRFLTRSTNKVRTGIGAARQDVNVSIKGGTRVEIKGVSKLRMIPLLTHNEAFRQKALLEIKKDLALRGLKKSKWKATSVRISSKAVDLKTGFLKKSLEKGYLIIAVNLPGFKNILSFFTQPGTTFANEISDRLKVIACLDKPNMLYSEEFEGELNMADLEKARKTLGAGENDAQIIFRSHEDDMKTALETVEERCVLAFDGVPPETRKSLKNGTTVFERVLPGPNRMYPDTDSAPIPITENMIDLARDRMPEEISSRFTQLKKWKIPEDTYTYILKCNFCPLMTRIISDFKASPIFLGCLIGHHLRYIEGHFKPSSLFIPEKLYTLFKFIHQKKLGHEIIREMLKVVYQYPNMDFESVLITIKYIPATKEEILSNVSVLKEKFREIRYSKDPAAEVAWIMGHLRELALGNIRMKTLRKEIEEVCNA